MKDQARRVLVTGGGSGIGLAVAQRFAAAGHEVLVAGRNKARLQETGLEFIEMDVTDERSVIDGVKEAGDIDIFIANAGAAETAPALKTSRDMWDRMIAVNLTSVYLCARAAIPPMTTRGWGRFIAVASVASLRASSYAGAYVAAKHGVLGWVKTLALELAQTGVTANAICPGYVDTPLADKALDTITAKTGRGREEAIKTLVKDNPQKRLIRPEEIADAALWLAGEAAGGVNGQAIVIDGGGTA